MMSEKATLILSMFLPRFQSLAILICIVLYIMGSASQAMQVGLPKRITIHHWLNMGLSLTYLCLTAWWFIWALRKSWPSVSDQFSFTWPPTTNLSAANLPTSTTPPPAGRNMVDQQIAKLSNTASKADEIKEHYTLWSPGFNAVYITQRTVAICYYFVYMRATFLCLNTPATENFVESKKVLVDKFFGRQTRRLSGKAGASRNSESRGRRKTGHGDGFSSAWSLGLEDYLSRNTPRLVVENENDKKPRHPSGSADPVKMSKKQVLWRDDEEDKMTKTRSQKDKMKVPESAGSLVVTTKSKSSLKPVSQKRNRLRRDKVIDSEDITEPNRQSKILEVEEVNQSKEEDTGEVEKFQQEEDENSEQEEKEKGEITRRQNRPRTSRYEKRQQRKSAKKLGDA